MSFLKNLVCFSTFIFLLHTNIAFKESTKSLALSINLAEAAGKCPKGYECIEVKGNRTILFGINPSNPGINWDNLTSEFNIDALSAARERAYTGQSALYAKLGACMTVAHTAEIKCKQKVAVLGGAAGVLCIANGFVFSLPPSNPLIGTSIGGACSAVVAGAIAYNSLTCEMILEKEKSFCTKKILGY
ncbi:hypothetical protein [Alteromonas ponticola]|uniref:DUF4189 domain-containing protein n=1 Tax=Alteromonas ponticola TaxID=2720613 RepID=A0ABX1R0F6_9ALTE|nr:hypothetical protein [Alteromonas ponticola]NMH59381.1 hypothetical protein [Alteromonas ponticola]